ncbi:MAG TPA: tetrathionate reductase family octaheme c-type cytochrome [Acidiferrobacterales bacterium]
MLNCRTLSSLMLAFGATLAVTAAWATSPPASQAPAAKPAEEAKRSTSTADHSKFKELQRSFTSGPEVTRACLTCHTEAAKQVHRTKHWTWEFLNPESGQRLGKKNIINNFCTAIPSNYAFCTACHVGYGWKDQNFDFKSQANVDCLVCHDTTDKYRKLPGWAGHPPYRDTEFPPHSGKIVKAVDLKTIAQNVGKTSRETCGSCHFYGGGGDGVKHGDMDSSLANPGKYLDVHMSPETHNFTCGTCHVTSSHDVPGSRYTPTAVTRAVPMRGKESDANPATCEACHTDRPHSLKGAEVKEHAAKLDDHTVKLACQTCHIPQFARGHVPTKLLWDWSTAGKLDKDGKPFVVLGSNKRPLYDSKKGDARYDTHVIPEYIWFNGMVNYTLRGEKLDPDKVVKINSFEGSPTDGKSKIWPVKVFHGKQPYDKQSLSLLIPHTFGTDEYAFWKHFDWPKALEAGMKAVDENFSGEYGFVATEMTWPITHMVAPKDDALRCTQCHSKFGRLQAVQGIYMPGRDGNRVLSFLGGWAALLALIGVLVHGALRIWSNRKGG